MEYKYNAFISYRHAPLDSELARLIQKKLENYHVPSGVKKETGKSIRRVFLDKAELPTSSNLSDDILDALNQSEYLIVICSTHTSESIWVEREIQAFLTRHPRSKIITVLADGEPGEVIPELLLFEERQVMDSDGNVHIQRVSVEPLSCDFRLERRRALREELPRLVASLLGVEYDQLRQRRKVYQMQRLAAVSLGALLVMACFTVYALRQSSRIARQAQELQEEYRQTIINQSLYFASEAQAALKENDDRAALTYGLRALPKNLETDPVTPQAKHALVDALGVYRTPAMSKNMAFPTAVANLEGKELSSCDDIILSEDGSWLIGVGYRQMCVWSAETMELRQTITPPDESEYQTGTVSFCSEDTMFSQGTGLVYGANSRMLRVDYLTGEVEWTARLTGEVKCACLSADEKRVLVCTDKQVILLDTEDGRELYTASFAREEDYEFGFNAALSPDGRYGAITCARMDDEDGNQLRSDVWLVDLHEKKISKLVKNLYDAARPHFTKSGELLVASFRGYLMQYNSETFSPNQCRALLQCYSPEDGSLLWEHACGYSHSRRGEWIEEIRIPGEKQDSLFFAFANYCLILDEKTGEVRNTFELRDSMIGLQLFPRGFQAYTSSGAMCYSRFLNDAFGSAPYFNDKPSQVLAAEPYYYVREGSGEIIRYELEKASDLYQSYPVEDGKSINLYNMVESDAWLAALDGGIGSTDSMLVLLEKDIVQYKTVKLPEKGDSFRSLLGFSEDGNLCYVYDKNYEAMSNIHCIDVQNGTLKTWPIPVAPEDASSIDRTHTDIVCCGGTMVLIEELNTELQQGDLSAEVTNRVGVYTWIPGQEPVKLCEYELYPAQKAQLKLSEDEEYLFVNVPDEFSCSYDSGSLKAGADGTSVSFLVNSWFKPRNTMVRVVLNGGKVSTADLVRDENAKDKYPDRELSGWSDSGAWCVLAWDDLIQVKETAGTARWSVSTSDWESKLKEWFFTPSGEQLVLIREDGSLLEYDVRTGELLAEGTISYSGYSLTGVRAEPFLSEGENCVMLQTDSGISIFDTAPDTFGECYWLEGAIACRTDGNSFLFWDEPGFLDDESAKAEAGVIRRCTVAELKKMAEERLGKEASECGETDAGQEEASSASAEEPIP